MANPVTGEVRFDFKGQTFTVAFDMAAIAAFEDETDMSIIEVGALLSGGGKVPKISTLGSLLAAGLRRHHPEIDRIKGMEMVLDPAVQGTIAEGLAGAMPESEDEGEPAAGPPAARGE